MSVPWGSVPGDPRDVGIPPQPRRGPPRALTSTSRHAHCVPRHSLKLVLCPFFPRSTYQLMFLMFEEHTLGKL